MGALDMHSAGMPVPEIAEKLGIPADAVREQVVDAWSRGRKLGDSDPLASKPKGKGRCGRWTA